MNNKDLMPISETRFKSIKAKLIQDTDFVKVTSGEYGKYGVKKGDLAYVLTSLMLPIDEKDPYLNRTYFGIIKLEDEKMVDAELTCILDARAVSKVSEKKQKELHEMMKERFESELS